MAFICVLSKGNIELASEEACAALSAVPVQRIENLLILEAKTNPCFKRLAYTQEAYDLLFTTTPARLKKTVLSFDWNAVYEQSFCVRIHHLSTQPEYTEREIASLVWSRLIKPKVNLSAPRTRFDFFFTGKNVYCGRCVYKRSEDFSKRKPHKRPGFLPISMDPRLARAMVNLTGIQRGTLIDPFCGTGGILIEAGLLGYTLVGYDIDNKAREACKRNLSFFNIKKTRIEQRDACTLEQVGYVATDLPYGRSSKLQESLGKLYSSFFMRLKAIGFQAAVLGVPSNAPYKRMLKKAGLTLYKEFKCYIHKSLTKRILVLKQG